jgi:hypothetical protein
MARTQTSAGRRTATKRSIPQLAQPGDWIEVDGTRGAGPRRGQILEVVGFPEHVHFRVRWDEKHESLFYPAERGCIVHVGAPGR